MWLTSGVTYLEFADPTGDHYQHNLADGARVTTAPHGPCDWGNSPKRPLHGRYDTCHGDHDPSYCWLLLTNCIVCHCYRMLPSGHHYYYHTTPADHRSAAFCWQPCRGEAVSPVRSASESPPLPAGALPGLAPRLRCPDWAQGPQPHAPPDSAVATDSSWWATRR